MNKQEAISAMKEGKWVKHEAFSPNEKMTIFRDGRIHFEDGDTCSLEIYFKHRTGLMWENGYSIVENQKPPIKGIELSTDYSRLWDLVYNGYRIAGWLFSGKYHENWDIVEIKKFFKNDVSIGTRGIGYSPIENTKSSFIEICQHYQLHFIDIKEVSNG